MLKMMNLREIAVKEYIRYMRKVFRWCMKCVSTISTRPDGGIVMRFAYAICAITEINSRTGGYRFCFRINECRSRKIDRS
jgi:hypothetical protein